MHASEFTFCTAAERLFPRTGLGVNPLVLNYRGNAFGQLGRFKDALADYREATEIFIKDPSQAKGCTLAESPFSAALRTRSTRKQRCLVATRHWHSLA